MNFPETGLLSAAININLSIAARQLYAQRAILIALLFITSIVLAPWKTGYATDTKTPPVTTPVKWHPGHYYTLMSAGKNNPKHLTQIYKELKETPALRGVQIRYEWAELESAKGVYNFTSIDQRLAELAAQKKRLIVLLQTKSFDPKTALVPDYLKAEIYDGGVFPFGDYRGNVIRGYNIKLWNPQVHNRFVALVSALGEHFNSHPYFEGIGLTETSMGKPMTELSKNEVDNFYNNLLSINQQLRKHFPNTMTFQFTNYPRPILESFIGKLKAMGTALGGPDVFLDDQGLLSKEPNSPKGVYNYYPELSGIVPLTPSVMQANHANTQHSGTIKAPAVSELLDFARDKLKANYIFWTRAPGHHPKILKILNEPNQTNDPAGGLDPTCPKAYSSCID